MNKLSNLLCLTGCGFHGHLEKGGLISPNMGTLCRAHELVPLAFFNIGLFRAKSEKLLNYILAFLPCCSFERCSETMPVMYGRSHPDPKTLQWWSTLRVMNPMGVKDGRGSKVPYEVHGFKGLISRRS